MLHVVMRQHVYCLGYVSFVLVMCSLPGLVLYRTRPGKEYVTTISLSEDGQLRPKHVGVFKKLVLTKVIVLKFLKF